MILNTIKYISYRCYKCEDFITVPINLFSFSGQNELYVECECQDSNIMISKIKSNMYFKIKCCACSNTHDFKLPVKQFFNIDILSFHCPNYECELLFVGDADKIEKQVNEYMEDEFKEIPLSEVLEMIIEDPEELLYDKNITCECGKCDPTIRIDDTMLTISCKNCKRNLKFDLKDTKSLSFIINSTNINI